MTPRRGATRRGVSTAIVIAGALTACAAAPGRTAHIIDNGPAHPPVDTAVSTPPPVGPSEDLALVLDATFDGVALGDEWSTCYWWQVDGGCTIANNDEQQWYRPEGVSVAYGALRLELSADEQETTDGGVLPYRSGMVSTGHVDADAATPGFAFTYGVVEARIRFPDAAGVWPAVWLLSADQTSLPEIDIVEWYGSRPTVLTSHVHARDDDERSSSRVETASRTPLGGTWHDVAVDWTRDRVVFYLDGVETGRVDDPELVPQTPMYLIVNLAAGGPAGPVDEEALPVEFLVDHVRVWQRQS